MTKKVLEFVIVVHILSHFRSLCFNSYYAYSVIQYFFFLVANLFNFYICFRLYNFLNHFQALEMLTVPICSISITHRLSTFDN